MTRIYKKRIIISMIFCVVFVIVGGFYLNSQLSLRRDYIELRDSPHKINAAATPLDSSGQTKYSYAFTYNGTKYTSVTLLSYGENQIKNGEIMVKFLLDGDGNVVLASEEKSIDGILIAKSCEEDYFLGSVAPGLTASIAIFCTAAAFALYALINALLISRIKSVERHGKFAYGVFVEAYSSKFGSNRYMAVRYSYKNEDTGEWVESVSPYSYSPASVETLKNMEAINIKYKGRASIIAESLSSSIKQRL